MQARDRHTYVISLPERSDRRARIVAQFSKHQHSDYEFYSACNGRDFASKNYKLLPGELGLWNSIHRCLIYASSSRPRDYIHICEDDCVFSETFFRVVPNLAGYMKEKKVDILFTDTWAGSQFLHSLPELDLSSDTRRVRLLDGMHAYAGRTTSFLINPEISDRIIALIERELFKDDGPTLPIDKYITKIIQSKELSAVVSYPFLTTVPRDNDSDIFEPTGVSDEPRKRWEKFFNLSSRIPYIEADIDQLRSEFFSNLNELDINQLKTSVAVLAGVLAQKGYIQKARRVI